MPEQRLSRWPLDLAIQL